jgi:hypothetical protein
MVEGLPHAEGFGSCQAGPLLHDWEYLQRTTCKTSGPRQELELPLPTERVSWASGAQLIVRARRVDAHDPVELSLHARGRALGTLRFDGSFSEQRLELEPKQLREPLRVSFSYAVPEAQLEIDHVVLLSRDAELTPAEPDERREP